MMSKLETEGGLSPSEYAFFNGAKPFKRNGLRRIKASKSKINKAAAIEGDGLFVPLGYA